MGSARWFVLEADWGGQVLATVPVGSVPAWGRRKRVRRALSLLNSLSWPGQDGTSFWVHTAEEYDPTVLRDEYDRRTHVSGSVPAGFVSGGMGGGWPVEGDLWLHPHILDRGLETVNRVRSLLGLHLLESLEVVWDRQDAWHARACNHYLDCHYGRRPLQSTRRRRATVRRLREFFSCGTTRP